MENKKVNFKQNKKYLSLYIHIPFCERKCYYCDFLSFSLKEFKNENEFIISKYIEDLLKEIRKFSDLSKKYTVRSIYIGGGTPSSINEGYIIDIIKEIYSRYDIKKDAEVTIEINPNSLTEKKAISYIENGINRVSIGAQSFIDSELENLGRIHKSEDIIRSYETLKSAGFSNLSLDLMFDIPGQTNETLCLSIEKALKLNPSHISIYSLEIEKGTRFYDLYKDGIINISDECELRDKYAMIQDILKNNGYVQYEISNFAKENKVSIHNMTYWEYREYLGFGMGASSFFKEKRFSSPETLDEYSIYVDSNFAQNLNKIHIDKLDEISIFVFTGLRKTEGINLYQFKKNFNVEFETFYKEELIKIKSKFKDVLRIDRKEGRVYINGTYMSMSSKIMCYFIKG